jgi:hypothetical protein
MIMESISDRPGRCESLEVNDSISGRLLHRRNYDIEARSIDEVSILLRGTIEDVKPGYLLEGDPEESLTVHHMIVELEVGIPELVVLRAKVNFEVYPHVQCPGIAARYEQLEGVSIARGFSARVRELFGGPRGCTHTTALLQAMAPVAVQSLWSMQRLMDKDSGTHENDSVWKRNTCHVWAENGELWPKARRGEPTPLPLPILRRMENVSDFQ